MAATVRLSLLALLFLIAPLVQSQDETAEETTATAETRSAVAEPEFTAGEDAAMEAAVADDAAMGDDAPDEDPATATGDSNEVTRDVVLVLDNSGSMRKNDPQSLATAAVQQFIQQLGPGNRVAVLIFDQNVTLAQDFMNVQSDREQLLNSLEAVDYSGQYTDSPAAIERAIYILKNNARDDARRIIIFMTDGIVDTGNPQNEIGRAHV